MIIFGHVQTFCFYAFITTPIEKTLWSPWFIRKYFGALRVKLIKQTVQYGNLTEKICKWCSFECGIGKYSTRPRNKGEHLIPWTYTVFFHTARK